MSERRRKGRASRRNERRLHARRARANKRMIPPAFERRDMPLLEGEPKVVGGRVDHQSKAREPRGAPDIERRPCRPTALLMRPWTAVTRGQ